MFNPCNPLGIGLLDFFGINELLIGMVLIGCSGITLVIVIEVIRGSEHF